MKGFCYRQRKVFCRFRIPESSCARSETIDKDTIISRNGDRKIIQPIRITSGLL